MARQRAGDAAKAAFGRVGAVAVPPPEEDPASPSSFLPVTPPSPARRDAVTSRRRRGAPRVGDSVALTVRFGPDQAFEVDEFVLALARRLRRKPDKSEVVRALLDVAQKKPEVREFLLDRLREEGS